eukprot:SAG31_NODE_14953_length_778_cov_2.072165_1_plen_100_part_00
MSTSQVTDPNNLGGVVIRCRCLELGGCAHARRRRNCRANYYLVQESQPGDDNTGEELLTNMVDGAGFALFDPRVFGMVGGLVVGSSSTSEILQVRLQVT